MQSALYYPFTGPERESFLKTALFLWDTVDFIVPYADFRPYGNTRDSEEALEIIGRNYVPTEEDKKSAHEELKDLCNGPLPSKFNFELERPERAYDFYPEKLLHETWEMLAESKLARVVSDTGDVRRASTGPLFGYYMMSILAVCCSQGRKRLVTDQNDPYRTLANILVDSDSQVKNTQEDWHERLIALSLNGPDFAKVSLRKLIDIRKNEDKLLQDLRRAFLNAVDQTASDICLHAGNPNTVRDLIDGFNDTMEKDLKELKRALGRSGVSVLLSKEFGFSVLAATAAVALEPISGTITTIGGLTKGLMDYKDRRHKILRDHPSSWLFTVTGTFMPIA
jgi:hypothetical protein